MPILRNLQNINTVLILGGLALCLVFMIQVKQVYNRNQKYNRYLAYKQYITEISEEMDNVEKTMNTTATFVRMLNEALAKREKDMKNSSIPNDTFSS